MPFPRCIYRRAQQREPSHRCGAPTLPAPPPGALPPGGAPAVGICTLVRDEARALREWLHHHAAVGVSVVYVYDDSSTDDTAEVLAPYEAAGFARRVPWPSDHAQAAGVVCDGGESGEYSYCQTAALNDCLERAAAGDMATGSWLAFVDTDEFLVPKLPLRTVQQAIESYVGMGAGADGSACDVLAVPGALHGSNGAVARPPNGELASDAFAARGPWEFPNVSARHDSGGEADRDAPLSSSSLPQVEALVRAFDRSKRSFEKDAIKPKSFIRLSDAVRTGDVSFERLEGRETGCGSHLPVVRSRDAAAFGTGGGGAVVCTLMPAATCIARVGDFNEEEVAKQERRRMRHAAWKAEAGTRRATKIRIRSTSNHTLDATPVRGLEDDAALVMLRLKRKQQRQRARQAQEHRLQRLARGGSLTASSRGLRHLMQDDARDDFVAQRSAGTSLPLGHLPEPSVITQGINKGMAVRVLESSPADALLWYNHYKMKSSEDWGWKQIKGVAQARGDNKWRSVTANKLDRNEEPVDASTRALADIVASSLGGRVSDSGGTHAGTVVVVDSSPQPFSQSSGAQLMLRLLHAAGAGVGTDATLGATSKLVDGQPGLSTLAERAMCTLPSAPAFGAGAPESLAAEPVSLEAARWGDDAARWVRQLVHSNAARQVRTQSAPALIGFDTARGDNAIVGGGGALALTLSHGTRWTSVLPPDSVFVVSIGEPVVVASDMLAAGWCDTLAQGHALWAALTVLTLDAVAQFRHKLVVAPAAKHAPRAVLRECMGALEVFGVSSCGGLMTPSEKELEWIANSSTATADAQHTGSGSAPNAAVGRGRDVGDGGRASASSPISLANALFAMARVAAAGTRASAFAPDVRTSDAAGWLGGVVGDGGSAATPLDIAYAAVRLSGVGEANRGEVPLQRTAGTAADAFEALRDARDALAWRVCAGRSAHAQRMARPSSDGEGATDNVGGARVGFGGDAATNGDTGAVEAINAGGPLSNSNVGSLAAHGALAVNASASATQVGRRIEQASVGTLEHYDVLIARGFRCAGAPLLRSEMHTLNDATPVPGPEYCASMCDALDECAHFVYAGFGRCCRLFDARACNTTMPGTGTLQTYTKRARATQTLAEVDIEAYMHSVTAKRRALLDADAQRLLLTPGDDIEQSRGPLPEVKAGLTLMKANPRRFRVVTPVASAASAAQNEGEVRAMSSAAVADSVTSHADNGAGILVGDDSGVGGDGDDTGGAHGVASSNRVGNAFIGVGDGLDCQRGNTTVLIAVMSTSSPSSAASRATIRATWGDRTTPTRMNVCGVGTADVVFVVSARALERSSALREEAQLHGDILGVHIEDFGASSARAGGDAARALDDGRPAPSSSLFRTPDLTVCATHENATGTPYGSDEAGACPHTVLDRDSYLHLPYKLAAMVGLFATAPAYAKYDFFMKFDEDGVVNVPAVLRLAGTLDPRLTYAGSFVDCAPVPSRGKWADPQAAAHARTYAAPYALGSRGYILGRGVVKYAARRLADMSPTSALGLAATTAASLSRVNEDAMLGALLAPVLQHVQVRLVDRESAFGARSAGRRGRGRRGMEMQSQGRALQQVTSRFAGRAADAPAAALKRLREHPNKAELLTVTQLKTPEQVAEAFIIIAGDASRTSTSGTTGVKEGPTLVEPPSSIARSMPVAVRAAEEAQSRSAALLQAQRGDLYGAQWSGRGQGAGGPFRRRVAAETFAFGGASASVTEELQWIQGGHRHALRTVHEQQRDSLREADDAAPQIALLGFHHSGTSIAMRLAMLLGIWGGDLEDFELSPSNPLMKFWERSDVVEANQELFDAGWAHSVAHGVGRGDAAAPPVPLSSWLGYGFDRAKLSASMLKLFERRAEAAVAELAEGARGEPFVVKDPRLCLTLPLWRPLLPNMQCVIMYRDPQELVDSMVGLSDVLDDGSGAIARALASSPANATLGSSRGATGGGGGLETYARALAIVSASPTRGGAAKSKEFATDERLRAGLKSGVMEVVEQVRPRAVLRVPTSQCV